MPQARSILPALILAAVCASARPATAQYPYGPGTPGSSGAVPRLDCDQPYAGNPTYAYRLSRTAANAPAALVLSRASGNQQIGGATISVGLAPNEFLFAAPLAVDGTGNASIPGGLSGPNAANLIGARFFLQAIVADAAPGGALLSSTNGLEVEVTEPPLIFLGGDTNFVNPDPFALIDPRTLQVANTGAVTWTNGATGAVFGVGGREVFVASRVRTEITRGDLSAGGAPVWSTVATVGQPMSGIALDRQRKLLYTVAGPFGAPRDLIVYDADTSSPSFGTELNRVPAITNLTSERQWDLSRDGNRLVLHIGGSFGNEMLILDTDPSSPTYLQTLETVPIVGLATPLNSLSRLRLRADGNMVFVLLSVGRFTMPSGLGRYDVIQGEWLDHNEAVAGKQPIGPLSAPQGPMVLGGDMDVARDGSFATFVTSGAIYRVDFDFDDPTAWTLARVPTTGGLNLNLGHMLTGDGRHALVLGPSSTSNDVDATLVDIRTGQTTGPTVIPGAGFPRTFTQR